jgi:hypothetical protein
MQQPGKKDSLSHLRKRKTGPGGNEYIGYAVARGESCLDANASNEAAQMNALAA